MTLNLHLPESDISLKPTITVIGVGGAGGNAVNNMITSDLSGVDFVVANTDAQALEHSLSSNKIQLGGTITRGLGAGANPQVGEAAAEEVMEDVARHIEGSNMVFITAGMGGGTGTGAAPVIAKIAREHGILTVAVVTKPFQFEGTHRMRLADKGLEELQKHVDTLIIIPNQNLFRIANERTTFADAFKLADEVLHSGVRGVTDLMVKPGLINLDFADIRAVMQEMGKAMMGTGEAEGDRRAIEAAEAAISNPLLDDVSLQGARSLLINITGGMDMTLFEVDEAANRIRQEVDPDANIILGSALSEEMDGKMRVSVVATGIDANQQALEFEQAQAHARAQQQSTHYGNADAQKKRPYMFTPQAKPEPVRMNAAPIKETPRSPVTISSSAIAAAPNQAAPAQAEQHQHSEKTEQAAIQMARDIMQESEPAKAQAAPAAPAAPVVEQEKAVQVKREKRVARPIKPISEKREAGSALENEFQISPRESLEPKDPPNTRGLFQRIADVSKVLATRGDEEEEYQEKAPTPVARTQVKEHKREKARTQSLFDDDEEYIDIPAFLRRQAN